MRHNRGRSPGASSMPSFVVLSGPPASGKSTLAPVLASHLGLPLLAKDTVKEALMSVLPPVDLSQSSLLGRASVTAILALAARSPVGAVLECNFRRSLACSELAALPGKVVEVFCRCEREVAIARYRRRTGRATGHFDGLRSDEELWGEEASQPVGGGWPVVEVDTNAPVDLASMLKQVEAALAGAAGPPAGWQGDTLG